METILGPTLTVLILIVEWVFAMALLLLLAGLLTCETSTKKEEDPNSIWNRIKRLLIKIKDGKL